MPKDVVLITGSSGYIGSALVRRLAPRFRIVGFDRAKHHEPLPQAEYVCTDLTSDRDLQQSFRRLVYAYGDRIACVVHLAAYYDFAGEPSLKYDEVNVEGTRRLLEHLQEFEVEQFVFSSSMLVHAPTEPGRPITEGSPLDPRWPYPESKVETEEAIREKRGRIPAVILRLAGVYDDRCHSIPLAHQIRRIYERRVTSHFFPGVLAHGQAYVHLEDLLGAVERVIDQRARLPPESVLLVGEPKTVSYERLQHETGRLVHNEAWKTYRIPKGLAKAGAWVRVATPFVRDPFIKPRMIDFADDHYELDVSRAREILGWEPDHTLLGTLPMMIGSLKAEPVRWYHENKLELPPKLKERSSREQEAEGRGERKRPASH